MQGASTEGLQTVIVNVWCEESQLISRKSVELPKQYKVEEEYNTCMEAL